MRKAAFHNLGCKVNAYEVEAMQEAIDNMESALDSIDEAISSVEETMA